MNDCDIHESIRGINLSYLALAQRMLREDRAHGMATLGLAAPLADLLAGLSQEQMLKLAAHDQLICCFRWDGRAMLAAFTARPPVAPAVLETMAEHAS
jgi:flagellar transcriptional activator FlhD